MKYKIIHPPFFSRYTVERQDKQFRGRVQVGEEVYASTSWEKNKKFAEQGAALVAVKCRNISKDDIAWKQDKEESPASTATWQTVFIVDHGSIVIHWTDDILLMFDFFVY